MVQNPIPRLVRNRGKVAYWHFCKVVIITFCVTSGFSGYAAAAHGTIPCEIPEGLGPLFAFLHTLNQVAMLGGISLGTLGFLISGALIASPIEDHTPTGKQIAKNVFLGVLLLLSAKMVVAFLTSQLGATTCV